MKQNRRKEKMEVKALMATLDRVEQRGFEKGVKYMMNKIAEACENDTPIELPDGKAYFIKDAISNLHDIFDDLEADAE